MGRVPSLSPAVVHPPWTPPPSLRKPAVPITTLERSAADAARGPAGERAVLVPVLSLPLHLVLAGRGEAPPLREVSQRLLGHAAPEEAEGSHALEGRRRRRFRRSPGDGMRSAIDSDRRAPRGARRIADCRRGQRHGGHGTVGATRYGRERERWRCREGRLYRAVVAPRVCWGALNSRAGSGLTLLG